jgi:hypothetical protein
MSRFSYQYPNLSSAPAFHFAFIYPVVLGSAGTLFKFFDHETKEMDIPNARGKNLNSKLHLHSIHNLQTMYPNDGTWNGKSQSREQGEG